jgi:V/A-type H+-transporting ATPase subunit E
MTGLEKIINDIQKESDENIKKISDTAENEKNGILKEASNRADEQCAVMQKELDRQLKDMLERSNGAIALDRKQRLLGKKQQIIADTVAQAVDELGKLPDDRYFRIVTKLAVSSAHEGSGIMYFGDNDIGRIPAFYEAKLNSALPKGSSLKISKESADIKSGFKLVYDGIEENCSFDAIIRSRYDEIQDGIKGILFV